MGRAKRIIVLGSTGSIGRQTLEVISHLNALAAQTNSGPAFEVVGLAAGTNVNLLAQQCATHNVTSAAIADSSASFEIATLFKGDSSAEQLVRETDADIVVAAMVGAAGLGATLGAIECGTDIALANKETLVAAGALVVPRALKAGVKLLPIDSEHAAVWQCLLGEGTLCPPCAAPDSVSRIILTASGGPFRGRSDVETYDATPAQALAHPTWEMGPKISIDSATLMNKALEVIEAHWLFSLPARQIDVVIHPQSIVHSLVEFVDGSIVAQLGNPDMSLPIQTALTFPDRLVTQTKPLDFAAMNSLEFAPASAQTHRALALAERAIMDEGSMGATINAANEAAVQAFLNERVPFGRILQLVEDAASHFGSHPISTLGDVLEADADARAFVESAIGN